MKVVLLKDIENIGKKYEVKEVKGGYARNYLIPRGLAKLADKKTLEWVEKQRQVEEEKAAKELERVAKIVSQIDGLEIEVPVKVGEKGQLFEKISAQKIANILKEKGYDIKRNQIELLEDKEIEETGEFSVKVRFEHNLEAELKIIVVEEES